MQSKFYPQISIVWTWNVFICKTRSRIAWLLLLFFLCFTYSTAIAVSLVVIAIEDGIELNFALNNLQNKQSLWFYGWITSYKQFLNNKSIISISKCLQNKWIFSLIGIATIRHTIPIIPIMYLPQRLILQKHSPIQLTLILLTLPTFILSTTRLILKKKFNPIIYFAKIAITISKFSWIAVYTHILIFIH